MIKITIVDDNRKDFDLLNLYLSKYSEEKSLTFNVSYFSSSLDFLKSDFSDINLIFLDIDMPELNGIELSRKIRKLNNKVGIVFVTNYFEYALEGYEVDAIDYLLKPLNYDAFVVKMDRISKIILEGMKNIKVVITSKDNKESIYVNDIVFIEIDGHYLIYHLKDNREIKQRGKLESLKKEFTTYGFSQINSYTLLNLRYVKAINKNEVNTELGVFQISRGKKKDFLNEFTKFIGDDV